jgi:hypothetical protein
METIATMILVGTFSLFFLISGMFLFVWYQFKEMKKSYWANRHRVEIKDSIQPIDLTPRPTKHGLRLKPKFRTDEKLFEIEQNPAKQ